jgi:hypothetical protein
LRLNAVGVRKWMAPPQWEMGAEAGYASALFFFFYMIFLACPGYPSIDTGEKQWK